MSNIKVSSMEVTQRIEFECCYIFYGNLEAHRCKLEVTVEGPQRFQDLGVVISYEQLRNYMKQIVPDKAFVYCDRDYNYGVVIAEAFDKVNCRTKSYPFAISGENLCKHFVDELQDTLDHHEPGIRITSMKLREDNNSFVSWRREDF